MLPGLSETTPDLAVNLTNRQTVAGSTAKSTSSFSSQLADHLTQQQAASSTEQKDKIAREAREKAEKTAEEHRSLSAALTEYLQKSPAEHLREAVMKELGLTEEDLAKMPPEKRDAMEKEINRRIRERLVGEETQGSTVPGQAQLDSSSSISGAEAVASTVDPQTAAFFASLNQTLSSNTASRR